MARKEFISTGFRYPSKMCDPSQNEKFTFALITASKAELPEQYLHDSLHAVIQLSSTPPIHQYELWWRIFYIITDMESMDILIKGSEY